MNLNIEAFCDIGQIRQRNEDMILVGKQLIRNEFCEYVVSTKGLNFFVAIADGMGGHQGGDQASAFVLSRISECVISLPTGAKTDELYNFLDLEIKKIHQDLNEYGLSTNAQNGMGSTFAGILFYENQVFSINIGDSRIYRLRGNILASLSSDHSLANLLNNPQLPQNHLANCFGGSAESIFFDFEILQLYEKDVLLICSDGLSQELSFEQIEQYLIELSFVQTLVKKTNDMGGKDNVSAVKIQVLSNMVNDSVY